MRKNPIIFYFAQRIARFIIGAPGPRRIYCHDTGEVVGTYTEYLNTRHWRLIKTRYRQRHRYQCTKCRSRENGLQLHHLHYRNIGREKDNDLIYLCHDCHVKEHKRLRRVHK